MGATDLLPLVVLLAFVGIAAFVGYSMYTWSNELADRGRAKMEKKNISISKDGGLKVGVRQVSDEEYEGKTQNVLVNVWNNASFPNYKSRLGWNTAATPSGSSTKAQSQNVKPQSFSTSAAAKLAPPEQRGSAKRSASPVPGSW